ncbi:uncharacterized protein LOC111679259 [Lucilia cuprina]|uniref:uncharacterized protein LOC111679259 n=1 Tax=Lucilia cuprina TaxID=7375 RepID=UPI001F06A901|nr:uncharacterized protein LOC111679259 [Lucilia cuprina]
MKFAVCTLFLAALLAVVLADSDAGHFIPKAFYTLDSNGHKSNLHAVNPHTAHYLRRLRRQVTSVSSSSSSVTGVDGVTHFTSQTLNAHSPEVDFSSRFGGVPATTGHVVQTTGVIDNTGKVYYNTKEGHF